MQQGKLVLAPAVNWEPKIEAFENMPAICEMRQHLIGEVKDSDGKTAQQSDCLKG